MKKKDQLIRKGSQQFEKGDYARAIASFQTALTGAPETIEAIYKFGISFFHQQQFQKAIDCLNFIRILLPDNSMLLNNLGAAYRNINELENAKECLSHASELAPGDPDIHANLGQIMMQTGEFEKAEAHLTQALAVKEDHINAIKCLCDFKEFPENHPFFSRLERLKQRTDLPPLARMTLCFSLGQIYHKSRAYDLAFENYRQAHSLRIQLKGSEFSIAQHHHSINALLANITPDYIKGLQGFGSESTRPIFIIGMPRSGTTLVEQIISSHSKVFGAGELDHINNFFTELAKDQEPWKALSDQKIAHLSSSYSEWIRNASGNSDHVTDKLPQNFIHLWLISILFPNARIIHVKRSPLDTCLSIYFQSFTVGHGYKNRLDWLGEYYISYLKLMSHWEKTLPVHMMTLEYETLLEDQETIVKKMLNFCNLDYEPACLEFYKQKRHINTASMSQVRKKIYKTSVNRWKPYEKHLAPLIEVFRKADIPF